MVKNSIKITYFNYYKINYKQQIFNMLYLLQFAKKHNKINLKFINLPKYKKKFVLLKSPKCYKIGKLLITLKKYNFFTNFYLIQKIIKKNKILFYFYYLKQKYFIFNTTFNKIRKINILLNIDYSLRVLMIFIILNIYLIYLCLSIDLILGWVYIFLSFLFMFLQVLFFTTCERKILALTQRRLGPKVVGDMGRLQYFADAIKLIVKTYTSPRKVNSTFFAGAAIAAFWFSWYNYSNLSFNYGEDIIEVEYNIFFAICCSLGFSIAWLVSGWSSVSKYALLGCVRASLQIISYEIIMSGIFLILFTITGTTNFELLIDQQINFSLFLFLPLLAISCFIATLMETNRPPFDLSEAESDVVAGYTVEYTGIMFGLFYLGEYVSLFTNGFILVILFSGGWWHMFDYFWMFLNNIKYLFYTYQLNYNLNINKNISLEWLFSEYYVYISKNLFFLNTYDIYLYEYNYLNYYIK